MSLVLYELSEKRTLLRVLLIIVCLATAMAIVYFDIISPENLAAFSNALEVTVLAVILFMALGLGFGIKKRRRI